MPGVVMEGMRVLWRVGKCSNGAERGLGFRRCWSTVAAATAIKDGAGSAEKVEVMDDGIMNTDEYKESSWISCIARRGSCPRNPLE